MMAHSRTAPTIAASTMAATSSLRSPEAGGELEDRLLTLALSVEATVDVCVAECVAKLRTVLIELVLL